MFNFTDLLFPLIAYLSGSMPFSVWVTRYVKNVDVRDSGSGHATTTNTIRQAGFGWGALVFVLDVAKGFVPVYLSIRFSGNLWLVAATAAFAVVGHCWPVFAQFRGGMGLATFGGALLSIQPFAFLICLALLIALVLIVRHAARATVFAAVLAAPLLWVFEVRGAAFWAAVFGGAVIALRFLIDWNRTYRELWLDREKAEKNSSGDNVH